MKHKFTPLTKLFDKGSELEQGSPSLLHVSQFKLKLKPDIPVSFFFFSRVFDLIVQFENNNFKVMNSMILERLDAGEVILGDGSYVNTLEKRGYVKVEEKCKA